MEVEGGHTCWEMDGCDHLGKFGSPLERGLSLCGCFQIDGY